MTADEYFQLPEGPPYSQLIDGELYMSPSPHFWNHQGVQITLINHLGPFVEEHELGEIRLAPTDIKLDGRNVFQPDLLFISTARLGNTGAFLQGPPDLAIEILSPSTATLDLHKKRKAYTEHGTPEIWFIDSKRKRVEIVRKLAGGYESTFLEDDAALLETPLLPGFTLRLSVLFKKVRSV